MKAIIKRTVKKAYYSLADEQGWDNKRAGQFEISVPKDQKFGDFSCNLAMILASKYRTKPRDIAAKLVEAIDLNDVFSKVDIAGPGFLNFTFAPSFWTQSLAQIMTSGGEFGKVETGQGKKVMVEFVSANPTGPLHIGHGRGAVVGDALARVLRAAGFDVTAEYYINDVGLQMDNLGRSTLARAAELQGGEVEEEPAYKGEYLKDVAQKYLDTKGGSQKIDYSDEQVVEARKFAAQEILGGIRADLDEFRVHFDNWFSEATLHDGGDVDGSIKKMTDDGHLYEKEDALWLKTESAGDEKDRVVRRANGITTYLAADIAYHKNKFDRGFETLVNVWGADHHGYVARMKAAVAALGHDPESLVVRLVQLVNLKKGGDVIAMSTREGVFTTLREIIDEVGVDATRYFFQMRSSDSHLDFDVELAKKQSSENPVFYVQYAHARCCNIFVTARDNDIEPVPFDQVDKTLLQGKDELPLIRKLLQLPDVVETCALSFQTHMITQYVTEVSALFHYYYKHNRVVGDNLARSQARLALVEATRTVLRNGLALLGVNAPERM